MSTSSTDAAAPPSIDELRAEAMEWGRKPRRRGSWYVTEHMVRAMRAYGWTIIVGAVGQPILYLLGLAVGLAALIRVPIVDHGQEVSYLMFVAPALLATATISVASEELTYPVMAGFKWRRYFYGFNASPLSSPQIANGVVAGATARMVVASAAYYLIVWLLPFGAVPHPATGWLAVFAGVLAGLAFGIPLMAYAGSIEDDKGQFALVQRFLFMPMFLFSGTFYPLDSLPLWLQWIGWVSPLWHGAELGRVATYGAAVDPVMVTVHLVYLLALAVVGYLFARRVFTERLAK
ncbi:lipooligosaccharide transport system permease protein [Microbacterium sp. AG790]|jgi:lipooligosaccharide transport system permease protein|uniref:ABC transporter permease n=1 Tax=Microbacterium sp. AG790 TaxID=2183995 RepID=UPI0002588611|nr:ABC transporter permease [Microbacterium sp. AG790]EIC08938.1 ABC-2 type transporter [Microbacterium laevaniformans OR221]RKS85625.1 lipooligosaccharide transport system permease protein [Microbacterium sp. AG790]